MDKLNPIRQTAGGITQVKFKAPGHERLAIEALSIDDLKAKAPVTHFASLQRADFYRLIGVVGGHTRLMVDFSDHPAQAGDWVLIRPGQVMRYDFSQPWAGWMVVFRPDSLYSHGQRRSLDDVTLQGHVDDLPCHHRLTAPQHDWMDRSLRQMVADGAQTMDLTLRSELLRLQLASSLLRLSLWGARDPAKLHAGAVPRSNFRRFRDKLEADFATQHQVQHYAQALGIGERSLSRLCLAVQGLSAKACVAQRLTLEAKRLLAHTTLSAQAIGGELGFDEATNFAKFFRKHTGMTPLAFRHAITDDGKLLSPLPPGHGPGPWPGTAPRPRV